jgi:hypothetical protein
VASHGLKNCSVRVFTFASDHLLAQPSLNLHDSKAAVISVYAGVPLPISVDVLRVVDPFSIRRCILQCAFTLFLFKNDTLNSLVLDKGSIVDDSSASTAMNICADCFVTLSKKGSPNRARKWPCSTFF